jgi:hypothetical protein
MGCLRFFLLAAIGLGFSFPALAYIDPGTGSMLVQSFLAVLAACAVFGRSLWHRVKRWFRRGNDERKN